MPRYIAIDIIFFLLPFAAYAAWLIVTRGSMRDVKDWQVRTISYLAIAGAVLLIAAIAAVISFNPAPPNAEYVPARFENGVLIPGHFERPADR